MSNPSLLGRLHDKKNEQASERASTSAGPRTCIPFVSGAQGDAKVQIFTSNDDEDRGGVVICFSIEKGDCNSIPAAKITPTGVELHLAGDAEAASLVTALKGALAMLPDPARYKGTKY
jgi:hypothetical protein